MFYCVSDSNAEARPSALHSAPSLDRTYCEWQQEN